MDRRNFSKAAAFSALSYSRILGANGRIGMALVGSGRRGREVQKAFLDSGRAELRVICDIYDAQRDRAKQLLGGAAAQCVAHEDALARRDVDAVLIAAPDHWHLDLTAAALAARKHVYLEKPAGHHFEEGGQLSRLVHAAKGSVLTVGTQQRSGEHYKRAKADIVGAGKLGKILFVRTWWSNFPWQARRIPATPKPAGLDWERFLGRTRRREYDHARYDSWRYFPEYGGGVLADILNHWADVAVWLMDDAPVDCVATGGTYLLSDGRVNPDTVNAIVRFSKGWNLTFESTVNDIPDPRPGVMFVGTEGTLEINRTGYVHRPKKGDAIVVEVKDELNLAHANDFLDAIRDNRKPAADIDSALAGLLPCHMARAAYWTGKRATYDASRNEIRTA